MYIQLVLIGSLSLVAGLCVGLEFNTTECEKRCRIEVISQDKLCKTTCLQESLKKRVTNQGYERQLPTPVAPRIIETGRQTIRLSFNSTGSNFTGVDYILEVKRLPSDHQQKNDVFIVFPYLLKYHWTNQTEYSVEDLEPNTDYQFRILAVRDNESSKFSKWSNITRTTKNCTNSPCGVSNIRVELTSRKPYKEMEELFSVFYWEPITLSSSYKSYRSVRNLARLSPRNTFCTDKFNNEFEREKKGEKENKDIITNKNFTTYNVTKEEGNIELYYGCWYKFELYIQSFGLFGTEAAKSSWIFQIPDCISLKNHTVCGCPYVLRTDDPKHSALNVTINTFNNTLSRGYLNWNNNLWQDDVNVTYYRVKLSLVARRAEYLLYEFYDAVKNLNEYNASLPRLMTGEKYSVTVAAYHSDHCIHHKIQRLYFIAKEACKNVTCRANSTCHPAPYAVLPVANQLGYSGEHICKCDAGFVKSNSKCIVLDPCENVTCPANSTCYSTGRTNTNTDSKDYDCKCDDGFTESESKECIVKVDKESSKDNSAAIIAGVVPALLVVIIISIAIIIWLRYFHRKRMNFIQREFEDAIGMSGHGGTLTNPYDYQNPIGHEMLPEDSNKEMNLLYVSQENLVIPDDLRLSIGLFELAGDCLKLHKMIGKGAFGEVYIGEVRGINENAGWTTVAVKTLSELVTEEEVQDFLREIELMKDLGKHENVIQMYGCCTRSHPICLVLEFASRGNLLHYLRSLKEKCKEVAAARAVAMVKSDKEKFQKFFEPGEMPDDSTSSFPNDAYKRPLPVKEAEALNLEVASQINEQLLTALDPKELEAFARQIACGMEHVSGLGIVHRDLAARNILLDENKVLKISDFGLSREGIYVKRTHGKIPFRWLAIEAIVERLYSTASDVWAFGIVLWEICTLGGVPYPTISDRDLKDFLLSGKRMEKVKGCSDGIYAIMLKCWSHLPEDRPSFTELSKYLWDLEHEGNTYVNVENLMQQSFDNPGFEYDEDEKDNNIKDATESGVDGPLNKGLDNQGFNLSLEDFNANDEIRLIAKKKESQADATLNKDEESSSQNVVSNGIGEMKSANVE